MSIQRCYRPSSYVYRTQTQHFTLGINAPHAHFYSRQDGRPLSFVGYSSYKLALISPSLETVGYLHTEFQVQYPGV